MGGKKIICKLYKKVFKNCLYCPDHSGGWSESHCHNEEPARVITKEDTTPFPEWCKLEDYEIEEK